MSEPGTFVKIHRSMMTWEWFRKPMTAHLFLYLILSANIEDKPFHGIMIHRGQIFTSIPHLAVETGLSERQVRTAITHLKATGEVTDERHPFGRLITVVCYDKYQAVRQTKRQSSDSQMGENASIERTQLKNIKKEAKASKKKEEDAPPPASKYELDRYGYMTEKGYDPH